ncbi:MAG: winged helix-turn-helix domain-containing protein [Armatimonadetes bacterium]|nr:winged helix-turn-helix domain-containing protein [Armatimonadota bacterium]
MARRTRDRLEMIRPADAGWSAPKVARHLRIGRKRVRHWIGAFLEGGFDALPEKPHPGQRSALTAEMRAGIRAEIGKKERTWTAQQIADWVAERFGLRLTADWVGKLLRRERLSYKRTSRSVKHKQDPEQVEAKAAELAELEQRAMLSRRMSAT